MNFQKITLFDENGKSRSYTLLPIPEGNAVDAKYISKYVSYEEIVRSDTAAKLGIDNTPNAVQIEFIRKLCQRVVDPAREAMGAPVYVSSGFRSKALNDEIKGSDNSQHMAGIGRPGAAIDLKNSYGGFTNKQLYDYIKNNLEFDQLIWEYGTNKEPKWVHVSYCEGNNRMQLLRET